MTAAKGPSRRSATARVPRPANPLPWFRRHYGAGPFHLLGILACFALAGYVSSQIADVPAATHVGVWFVGALISHDLILWPLYTLADRVTVRLSRLRGGRRRVPTVTWVNHIRVPAVLSGVLLAISFPLVLNWSGATYRRATGLNPTPYTARWLTITGVLFAASAATYLARYGRAVVRRRRSGPLPT